MNLLRRLFKNSGTLKEPEWWRQSLFSKPSASGVSVTVQSAIQVAAVFACVRILSEDVASLPLKVYRRNSDGSAEPAFDHPLFGLLSSVPNKENTSFELRQHQMVHLGLRGNTYSQLLRSGRGIIGELIPLDSQYMHADRNAAGELRFDYQEPGAARVFRDDQIWRTAGMGTNGVTGLSPIALARDSIGLAIATETHGASLFKNGAQVPQTMEHPSELSDAAYERLKKELSEKHGGVENAHKILILEGGAKLSQVGMTNEDSQFLQSRKFQIAEIARWYRMPLHMLAELDNATFSNIEHQSLEYVKFTLRPWLTRLEQTAARDLLLPSERGEYFIKHSVEGLLRGDTKTRYESYGKAIQDGWLSRNEVRELEDRNKVDGLDDYLVPLNMGKDSDIDDATINDLVNREIKAAATESLTRDQSDMAKWAKGFYQRHLNKAAQRLNIEPERFSAYGSMRINELSTSDDIPALINGWRDVAAQQMRSML